MSLRNPPTASAATRASLTLPDGSRLTLWQWGADSGSTRRGVVLLVHGLGEHALRHDRLAQHLVRWGFTVMAHDQRGHGESPGARGRLPTEMQLVDDLEQVIAHARGRLVPGERLIMLGHSLGGLVAAVCVMQRRPAIDGLVLSSPALHSDLQAVQKLLLAVLPRVAPNLAVGNGLDPEGLSHDPQVVRAYRDDPRVHDRIAGRLARFIIRSGPQVVSAADAWTVPTLLLWGGSDCIVNPKGSHAFAAAAPRSIVTALGFTGLRHEIFNELEAAPVYSALQAWLDQRA